MSTTAYPANDGSFNGQAILVGLHADHRPQDLYFARTQSRELSEIAWESRIKPLQSWGSFALWGIVVLMFAASANSLVR